MAMKKFSSILLALSILLCFTITGCSNESTSSVIDDVLPENITSIEMSGFYNGGELEPWELTQTEIDELRTWMNQLSLEHKTYAKGETPNRVWNGGTSYEFNVNNGEVFFAWVNIDRAYIVYDGEWYEIMNTSTSPLDLAD